MHNLQECNHSFDEGMLAGGMLIVPESNLRIARIALLGFKYADRLDISDA